MTLYLSHQLLLVILVEVYSNSFGSLDWYHFVVSGWHFTWCDRLPLLWVSPCESHSVTHFCFGKRQLSEFNLFYWEMYLMFESWKRNFHGLTKSQLTLWEMFPDNQVCGIGTNPSQVGLYILGFCEQINQNKTKHNCRYSYSRIITLNPIKSLFWQERSTF